MNLFKKLRYPDKKSVFRPALKEIPKELYDAFTMNGYMPNTKYWYFNEVFGDADSENKNQKSLVDKNSFEHLRKKVRNWEPLGYEDQNLHKVFEVYKNDIKSKSMVVIGTITPWIEAMSYEYNASQIITLDYTRKKWHDPKLTWYHVNDYLEEAMNKQEIELIDNAATFSSIEHSGLGRFGDPLNPDGDLDVMKQVHCMLKPGGIFFVGDLINTPNEKGELQFNAHRIYGTKRLELLFQGWDIIRNEAKKRMFVLRKRPCL